MISSAKKALLLLVLTVAVITTATVAFHPAGAQAETRYYLCQVLVAGPSGDTQTNILLKGITPAFNDTWFVANPLRAKEQLAVALAAMMTGKDVYVQTDLEAPGKPQIMGILLVN